MTIRILSAAILTLLFIAPSPVPKPKSTNIAYELDCEDLTIIVSPPGQITLTFAHKLAECLSDKTTICALQVVKLTTQSQNKR